MAESWSFSRVFRYLYEERKTGVLRVEIDEIEHNIHIRDGSVIDLTTTPAASIQFGDYLVASDLFSRRQLERLSRKAEKAGFALDDYLVHKSYLSGDVLARYIELQIRETVLELFERVGITCELDDRQPQEHLLMPAQPIPWFLKEAKRRSEHWPKLRKRIRSEDLIFDKVDAHIPEVLGKGFALHSASTDYDETSSDESRTVKVYFGASERSAYYFANGRKTVSQIAFAAGLGKFDAYRALVQLFDQGYIRVQSDCGPGERARIRIPGVSAVLTILAWIGASAAVYGLVALDNQQQSHLDAISRWQPPQFERVREQMAAARVMRAAEVFWVRTGEHPSVLDDLIDAKLTDEETQKLASKYAYTSGEGIFGLE